LISLSHIAPRNGKEKKGRKPIATADVSQAMNPGWLHLWIIIPHEVMLTLCLCIYLNAVKQQITLQKILPVEGSSSCFLQRAQNLKLRHWVKGYSTVHTKPERDDEETRTVVTTLFETDFRRLFPPLAFCVYSIFDAIFYFPFSTLIYLTPKC